MFHLLHCNSQLTSCSSYRVPNQLDCYDEKTIKLYCDVIRNFLNHVLQHEVCPEYVDDVMAARKLCGQAEEELTAISQLGKRIPGSFNVALSTLFGGIYFGTNQQDWEEVALGMTLDDVKATFQKCVQALLTQGHVWKEAKIVMSSSHENYEVTAVEYPKTKGGMLGAFKCKVWEGLGLDEYDVPFQKSEPAKEEVFYVDSDIVELIQVGMKVQLVVRQLDNGFKFFDTGSFNCSFYTYLENEKMMDYKEPVPNPRPGPTEDDPNAEERMLEGEMSVE
jgi:hypothetical protein